LDFIPVYWPKCGIQANRAFAKIDIGLQGNHTQVYFIFIFRNIYLVQRCSGITQKTNHCLILAERNARDRETTFPFGYGGICPLAAVLVKKRGGSKFHWLLAKLIGG
jgi:hypothetical protein